MRRFFLVVGVVVLAAFAISYGLRRLAQTPHAAVTTLLPKDTIALIHVPDFNRTREQWHESDIYQIYREPAVQAFLHRPMSKVSEHEQASQTFQQIKQLDPSDIFLAVLSIENKNPKLAGGFHFRADRGVARGIIANWVGQAVPNANQRESVSYEKHDIEIVGTAPHQVATVYDEDWFFLSNDLGELKAMLDRFDNRAKAPNPTLNADETFRAAMAHMPPGYALLFYLQPQALVRELETLRAPNESQLTDNQRAILDQMRSLCATTRFVNGKMHDVFFVGMPKVQTDATLARSSLHLGTKETFLYLATLVNLQQFPAMNQPVAGPIAAWLKKFTNVASRNGVTLDDWNAAFDPEIASLGDWPERARWPSIVVTLSVKDPARAIKVVNGLTSAIDEDAPWRQTEKEGIHYYYVATPASLLAITPTIALSDRLLVAGLDSASVEAAMKREKEPTGGLTTSTTYKVAARTLPAPTTFFTYVDLALLYSRLDTALRPMLVMSAAFMPAISDNIDVSKLPPQGVITKHLSPILASQRYDNDGYVGESIGPITMSQATILVGLPAILWVATHPHPSP